MYDSPNPWKLHVLKIETVAAVTAWIFTQWPRSRFEYWNRDRGHGFNIQTVTAVTVWIFKPWPLPRFQFSKHEAFMDLGNHTSGTMWDNVWHHFIAWLVCSVHKSHKPLLGSHDPETAPGFMLDNFEHHCIAWIVWSVQTITGFTCVGFTRAIRIRHTLSCNDDPSHHNGHCLNIQTVTVVMGRVVVAWQCVPYTYGSSEPNTCEPSNGLNWSYNPSYTVMLKVIQHESRGGFWIMWTQ